MVDTNSDPREVEYVIPANDDASKSIDKILSLVTAAIIDGLSNRGADAEATTEEAAPVAEAEVVAADVEVVTPITEEIEVVAPSADAEASETEI
jgi:small subunit ribosomal protein S2